MIVSRVDKTYHSRKATKPPEGPPTARIYDNCKVELINSVP